METINVKDNRMHGLVTLYDMQTGFFESVLEGVSDEDAHQRMNTKANHIAWLAGSLVQQRFEMANMFDNGNLKQQAYELFKYNKGIVDNEKYPSLQQYLKDWKLITPLLRDKIIAADADALNKIIEFPGMAFPFHEMLAFSIYREANHIGQMALWRRLLDYEPMKYM